MHLREFPWGLFSRLLYVLSLTVGWRGRKKTLFRFRHMFKALQGVVAALAKLFFCCVNKVPFASCIFEERSGLVYSIAN